MKHMPQLWSNTKYLQENIDHFMIFYMDKKITTNQTLFVTTCLRYHFIQLVVALWRHMVI